DVEVEAVEHARHAELHGDVANADDGVGNGLRLDGLRSDGLRLLRHDHIPIDAKKIANTPSITMTKKMPFTTEAVVCWPIDPGRPGRAGPSPRARRRITAAMTGALLMPTRK